MSWRPPAYNLAQREEHWYKAILESHSTFCGCSDVVRHFCVLASRLATNPSVIPALPAPPEQQPRPGGDTEGAPGDPGDAGAGRYAEEDLEELFAAAAKDDMRRVQKTPNGNPVRGSHRKPRRRRLLFTQSTPKRAREQPVRRRDSPRRGDPKTATTQAAQPAATAAASPQRGTQTSPGRRPPTPERSPLGPPPIIIQGDPIPDLLFPSTGKKRKFSKFDWETEAEIGRWLRRPMRFYPSDPPHYPWLPPKRDIPKICKVNFKINFTE
ncbi:unnamed protein product [Torque teno virus 28]|uniref:Hepatitis TT virus Orf2/Gyrovirus Vp2 N-terminal domain-containing protein n=3 Tax=Anelloviridae TaxID=687329 RepID=Q8V7I3_9VIRU|nr:hypothetical protein TTV28_gp1 [Torque teno virus 28]BAB79319.1 unnamed protein product [Torque teno virus 28]